MVIGSGPAGATTARVAAKNGLKVLLVDKHQELGAPVQCSGAVSRHGLTGSGIEPNDEFVLEAVYGFAVYNTNGNKKTIDYRQLKPETYGVGEDKNPLGYVVDRRRFDRYLMTMAERAGVDVWLKTEGIGYEVLENGHCAIKLNRFNKEVIITAKVLVAADGLQSQVGKWAGLQTHIKMLELASCLQVVVNHVETEGLLEIVAGNQWAPGGYAWVFPKGHGYAEIGLGVIRSLTEKNAQWHLDHFMTSSFFKTRFKHAKILEIQGGGVPLAAPLRTQYADNMILVGDAARHVNPITGGGIHTAISGGVIAGEFLVHLIKNNLAPNKENLKGYQDVWLEKLGNKMWKLFDIKSDFIKTKSVEERDAKLYNIMSNYFDPNSEFKKI